jgi:hypothetical protein
MSDPLTNPKEATMADGSKITDKAADLAGQAAAAAGPLKDRAVQFANQAAAAAGPLAAQAKELANQAAAAAAPITEQARVRAAQGVDVVAESIDKATRGKYSEQIHAVANKVEGVIDSKTKAADTDPSLKADTATLPHDQT